MTPKITREMIIRHLVLNGFAKWEARKIAFAKTNQWSKQLQDPEVMWRSGLIQKAIKSRRAWILNCRAMGYTEEQIKKAIGGFYRGQINQLDSSPWKFIRDEYMIPPAELTNYMLATKLREREQINRVARVMGVRYGRKAPKYPKPRPELFVKQPEDRFLGNP